MCRQFAADRNFRSICQITRQGHVVGNFDRTGISSNSGCSDGVGGQCACTVINVRRTQRAADGHIFGVRQITRQGHIVGYIHCTVVSGKGCGGNRTGGEFAVAIGDIRRRQRTADCDVFGVGEVGCQDHIIGDRNRTVVGGESGCSDGVGGQCACTVIDVCCTQRAADGDVFGVDEVGSQNHIIGDIHCTVVGGEGCGGDRTGGKFAVAIGDVRRTQRTADCDVFGVHQVTSQSHIVGDADCAAVGGAVGFDGSGGETAADIGQGAGKFQQIGHSYRAAVVAQAYAFDFRRAQCRTRADGLRRQFAAHRNFRGVGEITSQGQRAGGFDGSGIAGNGRRSDGDRGKFSGTVADVRGIQGVADCQVSGADKIPRHGQVAGHGFGAGAGDGEVGVSPGKKSGIAVFCHGRDVIGNGSTADTGADGINAGRCLNFSAVEIDIFESDIVCAGIDHDFHAGACGQCYCTFSAAEIAVDGNGFIQDQIACEREDRPGIEDIFSESNDRAETVCSCVADGFSERDLAVFTADHIVECCHDGGGAFIDFDGDLTGGDIDAVCADKADAVCLTVVWHGGGIAPAEGTGDGNTAAGGRDFAAGEGAFRQSIAHQDIRGGGSSDDRKDHIQSGNRFSGVGCAVQIQRCTGDRQIPEVCICDRGNRSVSRSAVSGIQREGPAAAVHRDVIGDGSAADGEFAGDGHISGERLGSGAGERQIGISSGEDGLICTIVSDIPQRGAGVGQSEGAAQDQFPGVGQCCGGEIAGNIQRLTAADGEAVPDGEAGDRHGAGSCEIEVVIISGDQSGIRAGVPDSAVISKSTCVPAVSACGGENERHIGGNGEGAVHFQRAGGGGSGGSGCRGFCDDEVVVGIRHDRGVIAGIDDGAAVENGFCAVPEIAVADKSQLFSHGQRTVHGQIFCGGGIAADGEVAVCGGCDILVQSTGIDDGAAVFEIGGCPYGGAFQREFSGGADRQFTSHVQGTAGGGGAVDGQVSEDGTVDTLSGPVVDHGAVSGKCCVGGGP